MASKEHKQTFPALLDPGFTRISVDDIDQIFLSNIDTPRRKNLCSMLRLFIHEIKSLGVEGELWVNGSFTTRNPDPKDLDVLLVINRGVISHLPDEDLEKLKWLTNNREYVRRRWFCDLYVCRNDDFRQRRYFERKWSENPDSENKKGIAVIIL